MKKLIFPILAVLLFCSAVCWAANEEVTLKQTKPGEWTIIRPSGEMAGTLKRVENGAYSIQLANGQYFGIILKTGELQSNRRHALFTPDEAQLYLDALKAIRNMK
ncbi:MAG: hypothetical protein LLG06_12970 [Desulfobacteraceae bacterium]|nr:hypothetical protein [Desulfobacteraceae bacterium]